MIEMKCQQMKIARQNRGNLKQIYKVQTMHKLHVILAGHNCPQQLIHRLLDQLWQLYVDFAMGPLLRLSTDAVNFSLNNITDVTDFIMR